jgi:hypothetical protein
MIRFFLFSLLIGLASFRAQAQSERAEVKISFSVTRFDPLDRPAPELVTRNGSEESAIEVPMTYIAGPYTATLREGQYLDFFAPGGEVPALSTTIPTEWQKDLLLVFVPNEKSYEILKVHAPVLTIPGGSHYIVNASPHDVAISYSKQKPLLILSKKSALLQDSSSSRAATIPVVIRQKEGDTWKLVSTENWPLDRRFRTFLFLYQSSRDQHMAFHGITQRVD